MCSYSRIFGYAVLLKFLSGPPQLYLFMDSCSIVDFYWRLEIGSPICHFGDIISCWPFSPGFLVPSFFCQFEIIPLLYNRFLHVFGLFFLHFISVQLLCLVIKYLTFNCYYIIIRIHLNIFRSSLPFFFFFFRIILFLCIIILIWALESSCLLKSKFDIFNGIILNLQVYHLHRIWYNSPVDQVLFLGLYSL